MEEPQPMDYVFHSPDASPSRSQTQHSQPASCPSWRPDQPSSPPTLPNPNPDPTLNGFRTTHPQPQPPLHQPTYDPVHASSNGWYPQQSTPFQWPPSIGLPPHSGYHSRTPSSDFYSLGPSGGVGSQGPAPGPTPGVPHQPVAPSLPFPDHGYGYSYPYRHPSIPRFPPPQPQYVPFGQDRSMPQQSTPRGIHLPALNPHPAHLAGPIIPPQPSHAPSHAPTQAQIQNQNTHTPPRNMSSSGESSPATPSGPPNPVDVPAHSPTSPTRQGGDGSASHVYPAHSQQPPPRLNPLPADAPSPTTPPVFASSANESGFRRQYTSRPPRVPRPSTHSSDYDSEEELERIEDEQMRFMEQYGLGPGAAGASFHMHGGDRGIRAHQLIRGQLSNKRVASKKAIASLESVDVTTLPEHERTCVICYNEFGVENPEGINEAPLRLPNCKHVFGDHCIKKWFEESDSCPYCRDKVPSEMILPSSATLQAFLRASYTANGGRLTISGGGPRPAGRQSGSRNHESDLYSRLRDEEPGLSPPRTWQTGERRSPPSEFPENRRRTRPRHFRSPSAAGANSSRHSSYGAQTTAMSSQHSPGRERVNPPNFQPAWYPFTNDPRRSLTPLFARQFAGPPRPYSFHNPPSTTNNHGDYGVIPFPSPPDNMMAYSRAMVPPTPYYPAEPVPNSFANTPPRSGLTRGWGQEQPASSIQPAPPVGQSLPPLTGYEPSGHPRPYATNNWQ